MSLNNHLFLISQNIIADLNRPFSLFGGQNEHKGLLFIVKITLNSQFYLFHV